MASESSEPELMQKIVSLCKRRGFVFQSSEIYGGLRSAYDYGPMGVELKRNLQTEWWTAMVHSREDIYGLDSSIVMHPDVWRSSGHLANFTDPLVDCHVCGERFRADKAPKVAAGTELKIQLGDKGRAKAALEKLAGMHPDLQLERKDKQILGAVAGDRGYVCPNCGSPFMSAERDFNGMFRTSLGPVDSLGAIIKATQDAVARGDDPKALRAAVEAAVAETAVYLRPETAQGMFVQFLNVQQSMSAKVPFGIAQMGKSFRNEVTVEHFIFRSCEFEQMELEYFVEPGKGREYLDYWTKTRMAWWQSIGLDADKLRLREHAPEECAFYSEGTFDIEYLFPWGWDELEGIASRTNYDLTQHMNGSGKKLHYMDPEAVDPETGKKGWRYIPHVVEPAAGATRGVLAVLCNAYAEEPGDAEASREGTASAGERGPSDKRKGERTVLHLHPRLAPVKCAVLPLVRKDGMPETARKIADEFFKQGINAKLDENHAIGRRYARHDEIGTPYCLTIDGQTAEDETVTIRYRDDRRQERIKIAAAVDVVRQALREGRE